MPLRFVYEYQVFRATKYSFWFLIFFKVLTNNFHPNVGWFSGRVLGDLLSYMG